MPPKSRRPKMDRHGSVTEGNTKRSPIGKYWAFTFNNYQNHGWPDPGSFGSMLARYGLYHFGVEVGEQGTPHYQGFCQFPTQIRPSETIKVPQISWRKCIGNEKQNLKYTGKSKIVFTNMDIVRDPMEGLTLLGWQEDILDIIGKAPDARKIHWFWEEQGGVGKTTFSKHLVLEHDALYVCGKSADIKYAIMSMKKKPKIIILDITRSVETQDMVSYQALEEVKNGIFFNTKYEAGMVVFNTPIVIVFANFYPDTKKMSEDRWDIHNI